MRPSVLYLIAHGSLILLGGCAAYHPSVRSLGTAARISACFGAGAVLLTLEALLFSILRIPWGLPGLAFPLLAAAAVAGWKAAARPRDPAAAERPARWAAVAGAALVTLASAHLFASLATSRSTSVDYLFFWGVKAVHFADARGIDVELLKWRFFGHGVPEYPPLVPIVQAWGILIAGEMPWRRAGPFASSLWFLAALPVVFAMLRRRIGGSPAAAVTAYWAVALAISLSVSYSGGNAEAPLLFYETVALLALTTETRDAPASDRWLPAAALAGAALTKVEALPAAAFLILGTLLRDSIEGRSGVLRRAARLVALPVAAVSCWFAFQLLSGLPVGYRGHGRLLELHPENLASIGREMFRNLDAGTHGMSWGVPAVLLLLFGRGPGRALPALAMAAGILLFLAFDYLHDPTDPWERIGWTFPRVSQPALSALILGAALAMFGGPRRDETAAAT
ncbi:MAG: hypothetical protein ABR576_01630 [Thermoanaerobaculia bacterium]